MALTGFPLALVRIRQSLTGPTFFLAWLLLAYPCHAQVEGDKPPAPDLALLEEAIDPESIGMADIDTEQPPHWLDSGHEYATNRAQALAQWTDAFFGAPVQDTERAESFMRVIVSDDWDWEDNHDFKMRVRGQVNLPGISRRADLVFNGVDEGNTAGDDTATDTDGVGLRINVRDKRHSRVDATLGVSSGPALVPGVRYRYQRPISDNAWGRFTTRLQYDTSDGVISVAELGLNRYVSEGSLLRWKARARYREDKGFWDWRSSLRYRQWLNDHDAYPSAIEYFIGFSGRDDPEAFTSSTRLGFVYRRQFLRKFLFYEIEPNYDLRKDQVTEKRRWVPGIVLRLEVMFDRNLVRGRSS